MGMCALAAVSMEWLLAFLMIKLKPSPQFTLHGQPSSVVYGGLAAVAWPLWPGRCGLAADWPVSLVGWGTEIGRHGCPSGYRCVGVIKGLLTKWHLMGE